MNTIKINTLRGSWNDIRARISLLRRNNFFSGCKPSPDLTFANIDVRTYVGDIAKHRDIPELQGRTLAVAYYLDQKANVHRHGPVVDITGMTDREADVAAVQALCDFYNNETDPEQISEVNAERLRELMIRAQQRRLPAYDKSVWVLYSGNNIRPFRVMDSIGIQLNTDYEMAVAMLNLDTSQKAA